MATDRARLPELGYRTVALTITGHPIPRQTRAAGSGGPPSGCGFLDQALQRQAHRVIKIGGGEVGSELQLGDEAHEEYAALLYW